MAFQDVQNPGIGGLQELTDSERLLVQSINALGAPAGDRILFYDFSAGGYAYLTAGTGLTITGTTMTASASGVSGTINEIAYFDSATSIASLAVATYPSLTELAYVKGVTSAIQTQLNNKQTSGTYATGTGTASGTNTGDNATNSQYSGLAASKADVGQTFYIGTTQVAINRASAALTLAGITLTTPDIGTPSAGVLTNATGLPIAGLVASTSTALGVGSIELGHATDTTISRVSAGVIAVEGVNVALYTTASKASTFTFNGTGTPGTSGSITMQMQKIGNWVTLYLPAIQATTGTNSTIFSSNTAVDALYRPSVTQIFYYAQLQQAGSSLSVSGLVYINSSGIISYQKDALATAWTNDAVSCGLQNAMTITYYAP